MEEDVAQRNGHRHAVQVGVRPETAMRAQDLSQNRRIARLTQLTRELEQSRTPEDTLRILERGFTEVDGFVASVLLSTRGLSPGHYRVVDAHLKDQSLSDLHSPTKQEPGPVLCGGILGAVLRRREPQLLQDVDWARDPFFRDTLGEYTSVMAIPVTGDRLPMTWAIGLKKPPKQFTVSDLEETVERAALVGALLENQILARELARAHQQIDRDARQVGELQRALLPASLPRIAGLEIAASYEPLCRAGGDLYDFFPFDERQDGRVDAPTTPSRWCVFIGDIEGHGLAAALVMAIAQAVLRAHPARITTPAGLLVHANRQLCSSGISGLVTAFLGIYEPASRRLTYARAGHPPPLLRCAADGLISALDGVGSYPLGIDDSETFQEASVQLERGDTLLFYTDGITEAQGTAEDLFGVDRLMRVFRDGGNRPAELVDRLRTAVRAHEHGEAAGDDQTLVAARVL
jgi:sigma-B regulation protein RsbU (phosphoserine phosphatase)